MPTTRRTRQARSSTRQSPAVRTTRRTPRASADTAAQVQQPQVQARITGTASFFQGPLPPPSILRGFEDILPGSSDRILAMAENQQRHEHVMQRKSLQQPHREYRRGQICAVCTSLGMALIGSYVILHGQPDVAKSIAGGLLGTSGIASIISTFLKKKK